MSSTEVDSLADVFAASSAVRVHSGNVHANTKIPNLSTAKDLARTVTKVLKGKNDQLRGEGPRGAEHTVVRSSLCKVLEREEKDQFAFTVKIFLLDWQPQNVKEAMEALYDELELLTCDLLIIQFPPPVAGEDFPLDKMKDVWKVVEEMVRKGVTSVVGTADLDKDQLEHLHSWAQVKPSVTQVNLESCCQMPPDLVAYAKEVDVRLHSHNDDRDVLPKETLAQCLRSAGVEQEAASKWSPVWVLKYTSQARTRNVLGHRGYIAAAVKN